jgi:hypothetical protein
MDSFWRAVAYCMHPRVIALSVLPLVLMVASSFALAYFFWDTAVAAVLAWFQTYELVQLAMGWLDTVGAGALRAVFAPLLVLVAATPLIVVLSLVLVVACMTPAMVDLVAQRRFPTLERRRGGGVVGSLLWSLWCSLLALLALVVSMPLWLIPPLVLVLPPLIWGWLTYRVFAFDVLAEHASADERAQLLQRHRGTLLLMGVLVGYLGAAPSLLWASSAVFIALAPLMVPLAIWVYALVFAFASLWFSHYLLAALQDLRAQTVPTAPPAPPVAPEGGGLSRPSLGDTIDVQAKELT